MRLIKRMKSWLPIWVDLGLLELVFFNSVGFLYISWTIGHGWQSSFAGCAIVWAWNRGFTRGMQ